MHLMSLLVERIHPVGGCRVKAWYANFCGMMWRVAGVRAMRYIGGSGACARTQMLEVTPRPTALCWGQYSPVLSVPSFVSSSWHVRWLGAIGDSSTDPGM